MKDARKLKRALEPPMGLIVGVLIGTGLWILIAWMALR